MAYSLENTTRISELDYHVYFELVNNTPALYNKALEYIDDSANYSVNEILYGIPKKADYCIDPYGFNNYVDFSKCYYSVVIEYLEDIERNFGAMANCYYTPEQFAADLEHYKRYSEVLERDDHGYIEMKPADRENVENHVAELVHKFGKKLKDYLLTYYDSSVDDVIRYSYDGELFDDYYIDPDGTIFEVRYITTTKHFKSL